MEQQVAEVAGVERRSRSWYAAYSSLRRCRWRRPRIRRHRCRRGKPLFFQRSISPASWRAGQRFSSRSAATISCLSSRNWSSVSRIVKFDLQPDQFGVAAQHLGARSRGRCRATACPRPHRRQLADPLAHFARGLVGEGDGQDLARPGLAGDDQVGEPRGERGGLAGAGAGEHQHRALGGQHRLALRRIEAGEIGGSGKSGRRARALAPSRRGAGRWRGQWRWHIDLGQCQSVPAVCYSISPLSTGLPHRFSALRDSVRGASVLSGDRGGGCSLTGSAFSGARWSEGVAQRPDLCRQAMESHPLGGVSGASREEAPEEMDLPFARRGFEHFGGISKAGRGSDYPKKGRGTSELPRLRTRHERTQAELPSGREVWESEALHEPLRWKATPELVVRIERR